MPSTRRSLTRTLLTGAALAPLGFLRPGAAVAQMAPGAILPDVRALLEAARSVGRPLPPQARLSLERTLQRMDDLEIDVTAGRQIVVNIPGAEVIAYEDGREVMRSRVIVGGPRTRTPQLATFVTTVRFNPPWYVPASIEPEIRAKGLSGFQVVNGRLIQPPGPRNPLGPLRVGLEESDAIYLHGTANPELFTRGERNLSHGCIRVERIVDLSAWLLDTTPAAIRAGIGLGRTVDLAGQKDVRVALGYLTAWPNAAGRVVFHPDPYGFDQPGGRRVPFRRVQRPLPPEFEPPPPEMEGDTIATLDAPLDLSRGRDPL
ncbi:L,D-transpeptidase family protein [Roseomonas sp. OT10]|uniref:L,D-transpeptidase family protein n=1 Tax=Roseomonas cutis TaxID=2897332 RepID=UPI001E469C33|nr:L,D-transpeptidase family protein [Roseomonas sp. OT10]UFN50997.1 L,D-transpeptidase family protein [Roseomonas sp. OT10]